MNSSEAHELKQAGAIEAAQDPNSTVTPKDARKQMVADTKKAGGAAFEFDPNASPEEKAAQARAHIPAGFHKDRKPSALAVVSDADGGTKADYDLPSPSKAGAIAPASPTAGHSRQVSEDMRWARDRTGWAPQFVNPKDELHEDVDQNLADHQTWLEGKLDDKWFGDWYYNAGVIIFSCLATYIMTILGGGLAACLIIMACCSVYYRTSLRRVRRNFRDDVHREMAKAKLETDTESLEWMNSFLVKFWPIFAPVLCDTIINSVDQVLSTSTPAFLESLRMKTFILGTKPPRLEHVRTYPKSDPDTVLMDWKFSFNPNDTADMTARQLKSKINPKIVLEVRVGKGIVSKGLDVIVEDFAFSGLMRVKVKLQIPFPHIEKAEICFLDKPAIDYVCKPLGGDHLGFDINFIPGLEGFILSQIHGNLAPIMYDPNVFPIEIAKMLSGNAVDQAIGVVQVQLFGGQGLKNPDKFPGIPDPYITMSINNKDVLAKTKMIPQTASPQFNETHNIIITSLKDSLTMGVFDYNEYRKDKELGILTFPLDRLEHEAIHENTQLEVMSGGRARGSVQATIRWFPVLEGEKNGDGSTGPVPESNTGIAKFTVEQAKDLDGSKSLIGTLNPYAVLLLNQKEIHVSQKLKRTNNPIWPNAMREILITDRSSAKLGLVIKDDRDLSADPILGTYQIKVDDMLELMSKGQEWYNLAQSKAGRVKMMLQWKPIALKAEGGSSGGYITPIGVMRLHFQNARDLRNLETMGKSDPYVRVLLSGIEKGRTVTFKNNLNPDWDEVIYVPMHSTREKLTFEVMDTESLGKDRPLGMTEIKAADFIHQDDNGEYLVYEDKSTRSDLLRMGNRTAPKGTLNYTCSFYPTYAVEEPEDKAATEKEKKVYAPNGASDPRKSVDSVRKSTELARNSVASSRQSFESARRSTEQLQRSGTISSLHKTTPSTEMARQLTAGEKEQVETTSRESNVPKIKITDENLTEYESGLLVLQLLEGNFAHSGCYVEVVMDDMAFPSYRSSRARTREFTFNETGDAMVRELDVSKITVRLREKGGEAKGGDEDKIYAKMVGHTLDVLRQGLYKTHTITLRGDDGRDSTLSFQLKYLPVKMTLDPSESINNMGMLRCDVLDAADLPAADRNGFSDPYCKFMLNDKQIFKTGIQKKTLHPAWNEFFEVPVPSRTAAKFKVLVYDWDFDGSDDFLGAADINLQVLEPFESQELHFGLDGKSGTLRLKMVFKPDYVTRSRQGTSTLSGTFATPGKVVGAPVKGVGKGAMLLGSGVARSATFVSHAFRRRKSGSHDDTVVDHSSLNGDVPPVPHIIESHPPSSAPRSVAEGAAPATPGHRRLVSNGNDSIVSAATGRGGEIGTATISVVSASGYEGANVRVFIKQQSSKGAKEVHKTKAAKGSPEHDIHFDEHAETFKVNNCTENTEFTINVKDAHTFGSDTDLGNGSFVLNAIVGSETVTAGKGFVVVKGEFTPGASLTASSGASIRGHSPGTLRRKAGDLLGRSSRGATPVDGAEP